MGNFIPWQKEAEELRLKLKEMEQKEKDLTFKVKLLQQDKDHLEEEHVLLEGWNREVEKENHELTHTIKEFERLQKV